MFYQFSLISTANPPRSVHPWTPAVYFFQVQSAAKKKEEDFYMWCNSPSFTSNFTLGLKPFTSRNR